MSISTELSRLQGARDTLRNKAVELGIAQTTAKLDGLATAFDAITNNGSVTVSVKEGETYTIPKGYHNGSGTVSGVAGGGNYTLISKTVTPTKSEQNIVPDEGYYGLSDVTVAAIPVAYQDVTSVTAGAADVLVGKTIVASDGTVTAGTMANNGSVVKVLDTATTSVAIAAGYHDGTGSVSIELENKEITPTKAEQNIAPSTGKVLSAVKVAPIPDNFIDTTDATATAAQILDGETAYINTVKVEGAMPNNGAATATLDTKTTEFVIPEGYHNGEGKVNVVVETKSATPTKAEQVISASDGKVLSSVTVAAIPAEFQDVTGVTATAEQVLTGADFVAADGSVVSGTMANNGAITQVLDIKTTSYTVPAGFHSGEGAVSIVLEEKAATPTEAEQTIAPTSGKVLSKVTVAAIPSNYKNTADATVSAEQVLVGAVAYGKDGQVVGTMANNGDVSGSIDGLSTLSVVIPAGYTTGGTISLTNDIETALAAI